MLKQFFKATSETTSPVPVSCQCRLGLVMAYFGIPVSDSYGTDRHWVDLVLDKISDHGHGTMVRMARKSVVISLRDG